METDWIPHRQLAGQLKEIQETCKSRVVVSFRFFVSVQGRVGSLDKKRVECKPYASRPYVVISSLSPFTPSTHKFPILHSLHCILLKNTSIECQNAKILSLPGIK